jgi:phosphoribosylaminoimidazole carboxylase PurE protein
MSQPVVAILMGSKSDLPKLQSGIQVLKDFGVPHTVRVMSAHRTPAVVMDFTSNAKANGYQVIIAAAGVAAHLAGVVAAHTPLPVIGIPVNGGPLNGMDALLATVQMPGGIPVATTAIGSMGAKNAALLAIRILALKDEDIAAKLDAYTESMAAAVIAADEELQAELG